MDNFSVNGRIIVETYTKEGLKGADNGKGFKMIEQKVAVKGLTILMDAKLADGTYIPKGSLAYIREEHLYNQAWAQKPLRCDTLPMAFLIVDLAHVEWISPPQEKPAA
jgi:hypothetical protein